MKFRFKTKPYKHQLSYFEEHRNTPKMALLWQMRTGKTKVCIDTAAYQQRKGKITGLIVVAPNGVHENWILNELPAHCSVPWVGAAYRASSANTKRFKTRLNEVTKGGKGRLEVLTINCGSVWTENGKKAMAKFLKAHKGKLMLVVDEAHDFRTPSSKRTRVMKAFAKHATMTRILSGTISSNSPLHVWAPYELLEPGALGFKTYTEFKARYAVYRLQKLAGGRQFEQLVTYQNLDELQERMASWSDVVLREDCDDMPDLNHVERKFDLLPAQKKAYDTLSKEFMLEEASYDGGARLTKLQQIASGWYRNDEGDIVELVKDADNPRLQALLNEFDGFDGKAIVWCKFKEDIRRVVETLRKNDIMCVEYHGGVNQDDRNEAIRTFMKNEAAKVFVGQPAAGGTGLNLSAAKMVVWYSHTFDLIEREQASERATRVGGTTIDIVDIAADKTVDTYIMKTLKSKAHVSDDLAGRGLKAILMETSE